jgi:hypothetical protein
MQTNNQQNNSTPSPTPQPLRKDAPKDPEEQKLNDYLASQAGEDILNECRYCDQKPVRGGQLCSYHKRCNPEIMYVSLCMF